MLKSKAAWTLGVFACRWDIQRTIHPLVRGNAGSAVPILQVDHQHSAYFPFTGASAMPAFGAMPDG